VDASDELDLLAVPAARSSHARKVYDVTAGVVLLSVGYKHNGIRYVAVRIKDTLRREGATKTNTDTKRQTDANLGRLVQLQWMAAPLLHALIGIRAHVPRPSARERGRIDSFCLRSPLINPKI
jgi:hypothetical protein